MTTHTPRPIAVGDRVRGLRSWIEDEQVGVVVRIGDQTPHPSHGEPYSVGVRLDDGGRVIGHRLSELERLDDPHTSSAPLTEDPADTDATPCATSATPDTATPDADPAPEAGAASAHDAAPARLTYADPVLTRCPGCKTCQVREARARHQAERDPRLVAEALRRDGVHCRYCGTPVAVGAGPRRAGYGRVRATAYGVMLICGECSRRRVDEEHAPLPLGASAVRPVVSVELDEAGASGDPHLAEGIVTTVARGVGLIDDRRDCAEPHRDVDGSSLRGELDEEASALDERVGDGEGERRRVLVVDRVPGACVLDVAHETSPSDRAEAPESPQLMTDTVGDGSTADTVLPHVGGRAVPPVPAPADTTSTVYVDVLPDVSTFKRALIAANRSAGASSVHDAAPVTDLTTLQDADDRLAQVRAELDRLTALEYELAMIVTDGLRHVLGLKTDLTWCVEPPAGSAS